MTAKKSVAVLALILLLPILCGSAIKLPEIKDVEGHWAAEHIIECTKRGICEGFSDGYFRPDRPITRAEFTKMVVIAFNINSSNIITENSSESVPSLSSEIGSDTGSGSHSDVESESGNSVNPYSSDEVGPTSEKSSSSDTNLDSDLETAPVFDDVIDHWAKTYIEAAYSAKLILGVDNLRFMPDKALSRQDAILILSRIEKHHGRKLPETVEKKDFLDAQYIREDCLEAITHFQKCGIIVGKTGNLFDPIGSMSRAEVAECIILTVFALETPV